MTIDTVDGEAGLPDAGAGRFPGMPVVPRGLRGGPADGVIARLFAAPTAAEKLAVWFDGRLDWRQRLDREALLAALDRDIALIDRLLNDQVNAILHHPRLQALEATWRGLAYLVEQSDPDRGVKIKVLGVRWQEICRDLERAIEFDQSSLFDLVYNQEFGMPGGEPYGILLADYRIQHKRSAGHSTDDVAALKGLSAVAAAAFCPIIVGAKAGMLGLDSFAELGLPIDIERTLRGPEYERWRSLQKTEDARFLGVVLPQVLMRLPYGEDRGRIDGFCFHEDVSDIDAGGYLWGNAIYPFGAVVVRAFHEYGWFADIRGAARDSISGGLVMDLPVACFDTDRPGAALKYSVEVSASETQEKILSEYGFIPLMNCKDTVFSAFYSNQSIQVPKTYNNPAATANARLSSMIQYMLCVARFSHYIKVIARDWVGTYKSPEECQAAIRRWLQNYLLGSDEAGPEMKARYPLREAQVQVTERPGAPGSYTATVHLRPHFQLDQIISSFRLVTELPASAG